MYLVAIGYAYVVFLMALTSRSWLSGLAIAVFVGVLPLWIFIKSTSRSARKRKSVAMHPALGQGAGQPDGEHAKTDE
jgi:hypothetical protein